MFGMSGLAACLSSRNQAKMFRIAYDQHRYNFIRQSIRNMTWKCGPWRWQT